MTDNSNKNKVTALVLTVLITALTIMLLVTASLHYEYPPKGMDLITELRQDSIMFGGEFVMLGDTPDPTDAQESADPEPSLADDATPVPEVEADQLEDLGEPTREPAPVVTAKQESPMKVKEKPKEEKPKKPGPATTKDVTEKNDKAQRNPKTTPPQTESAKPKTDNANNSRVKNAFGNKAGNTKGSGKQGSPEGNAPSGELRGQPGIGGLVGYTGEHWGRPHSKWEGTVKVRVRVNTRGRVVEAKVVSGSGPAWTHPEVQRECEKESLKSAFSVPKNTTTEGVGYITWKFI